ncbi:MAG: TetR/AcrR family transcriptional regulator [Acidimicrobiia bacterium]|nr:TetR/AcrR family transcriptional regulator [Acidimicrobiia bacterium]
MSSTRASDTTTDAISETESDLTTKARIRQAAVVRFPIDGFSGTTVRSIATAADVSPGLVIHHFGSKDNLRSECDDYVIRRIGELRRASVAEGTYQQVDAVAALFQLLEPEIRYLAWALGSGGSASDHVFDLLLADVVSQIADFQKAGLVSEIQDPQTFGAVLLTMRLGGLVLHEQLSRTVGFDTLSPEGLMELAPHTLSILSGEVFDKRALHDAASALDEFNRQTKEKEK